VRKRDSLRQWRRPTTSKDAATTVDLKNSVNGGKQMLGLRWGKLSSKGVAENAETKKSLENVMQGMKNGTRSISLIRFIKTKKGGVASDSSVKNANAGSSAPP
jgi:hypothetical protein